jgi:hypothetical protein
MISHAGLDKNRIVIFFDTDNLIVDYVCCVFESVRIVPIIRRKFFEIHFLNNLIIIISEYE